MKTLSDLDLHGQRVLVRVDFNVPMDGDVIADDTRIRAALATVQTIADAGGKAILMSHFGRPKNGPDPKYSLRAAADRLAELIDAPVTFTTAAIGSDELVAEVDAQPNGSVLVLENTRFYPGEEQNDDALARQMAALADIYVNDAFGSAHRAHASTEGVVKHVKVAALGPLMEKEVRSLSALLGSPERPFVGIVGGAKVSDKIGVIENLLARCDAVLIGGAMAYTFLKALGHNVGASKVEDDKLDVAKALYDGAGGKLKLPVDHVVADRFAEDAATQIVDEIPEGWMALDIGPKTVDAYREIVVDAKTVVWNGPMGVFEMKPFARGTMAVAKALVDATKSGAMTVVGGGDSVAAVAEGGYEDALTHVSTGGGAMLEFLEGKTLPGVAALL
ncbi:MAG: phosphoglycerate kinase [Bacteroidetes bacterium]|nr:phosphoglycerate kinase [Bacteroidota bacterium]